MKTRQTCQYLSLYRSFFREWCLKKIPRFYKNSFKILVSSANEKVSLLDDVGFQAACESFGVNDEAASKVVSTSLKNMSTSWSPGVYRWVEERRKPWDLCSCEFKESLLKYRRSFITILNLMFFVSLEDLSKTYNKTVSAAKVISVTELQAKDSKYV